MLGKWWQPPSKKLLEAGHEKHTQKERKCLVRSAVLSKKGKCPRLVHSACTTSGAASAENKEKPGRGEGGGQRLAGQD